MDEKIILRIGLLCILALVAPVYASEAPTVQNPVVEASVQVQQESDFDSVLRSLSAQYSINESVAREIIRCESAFYEFAINENIDSAGTVWSIDYGYFQINDYYHRDTARSLGLDIERWEDNLEYGFILLSTQGVQPWSASKNCHKLI